MSSERIQRQIDQHLDAAEAASLKLDWHAVVKHSHAVLDLDRANNDAPALLAAAEGALARTAPVEQTAPPSIETPASSPPPAPSPSGHVTTVSVVRLRQFLEALFRAAGYPEEDVQAGSFAFLLQEMRGVQTHALRRLRQMLDGVKTGRLNANANRRVLHERQAALIMDGDSGLGITSCLRGMEHATRLSKQFGVGIAIVKNSNHFLAAAPYCISAAEQGVVSLAFASVSAAMAYPGTNADALGISPVGYAVPTTDFPIVFDAALTVSGGMLNQLAKQGGRLPDGLLTLDSEGNPTSDPAAVLNGGARFPIGLHKGAGLGILVEVLTSIIGGQSFLRTLRPEAHSDWRRKGTTHSFLAIDVEAFMPIQDFRERMTAYVADLKAQPLAPGYAEILLPGERAARSVENCLQHGVPLEEDVVTRLLDLSTRYSVPPPFPA